MNPQEYNPQPEPIENRLSTADLANAARVEHPVYTDQEQNPPLFAQPDAQEFRTRWQKIQTGFVDEPRNAVQQADELVANTIQRLAQVFSEERTKLEAGWDRNDDVSTEDLRVALRRYRSFFDRLLSV